MKLLDGGAVLLIFAALYWVVSDAFTEPQCYVQTNEKPYVAKWMSCNDIPSDWIVLENADE